MSVTAPIDVTSIDGVGRFLEHRGMSDEAIDTYFEHHGVRGMKWGQRKLGYQRVIAARRTKTSNQLVKSSQDRNRRLATIAVAAGTAFVIKRFAKKSPALSLLGGVTASAATNAIIRSHQEKKMSEISYTQRSKP